MSYRSDLTVEKIMDSVDPKHEWYNDDKLVKTGKHWLFETSDRGFGKSTRTAIRLMANFIVKGSKWLYLRRNDRLLNATKSEFFDNARDIINRGCVDLGFCISYFKCDAGRYYMKVEYRDEDNSPDAKYDKNGEIVDLSPTEYEEALDKYRKNTAEMCGLAMSLNTGEEEAKSGGAKFRGVKFGVFDEFIAERNTKYLGTADDPDVEYEAIYSIYGSVARDMDNPFLSDVYFFFLGNWAHDDNPILLNCGVNIYMAQSPEAKMIAPKGEEWAIEFIEPTEGFKNKQKESVLYKLAKHSKKVREYTFLNKSRDIEYATNSIVKNVPKDFEYLRGVALGGVCYGVYYRKRDGGVYIGNYDKTRPMEAMDVESYANGNVTLLVKKWRDSGTLNLIYKRFLCKRVWFKDKSTQKAFLQYLDFIPKC